MNAPARPETLTSTAAPMGGDRKWGAPEAIIASATALVTLIIGIFVLLCIQGYARTIETTKERGQIASEIVAEGTRWVLSSARTTLIGIEDALQGVAANADAATLAAFESLSIAIPAEVSLGIYDAAGVLIAVASSPGAAASIAETDYFATLRDGAEWTLTAQERDAETEAATFGVVKRLDSGGEFTGVAKISISAKVLERLSAPQDLGTGSTISLVRTDGWVIARDPSLAAPLDLKGMEAWDNLAGGQTGSYVSPASPADGVSRIVSFRHVDDLGFIALASIATESALAGLWSAIWIVSLLIAPIAVALLVGSIITARVMRRTQSTSQSLAAALQHNQVLFREIHHRVKNNLQAINSLVQLQPIPREVKLDMNQRIAAMAAVHEHIYRSDTFSHVQIRDYLVKLIENIRAGNDPKVQVTTEIEDVAVDKDSATPLGLIVNEVVSNAFKHAFKDGRQGSMSVTLKALGEDRARLTVRDNGVGFDPDAPAKGIGRRLIGGLTSQLQGESSHVSDAEGSVFTLEFPLARR